MVGSNRKDKAKMKTALYKCVQCEAMTRLNTQRDNGSTPRGSIATVWCREHSDYAPHKRVKGTTIDSCHKVYMELHRKHFTVDTDVEESFIRNQSPLFFRNVPHNSRETITFYKGALIVRNTVRFTHGQERTTAVYLFGRWQGSQTYSTAYVNPRDGLKSIAQAKRHIDRILEANRWSRDE
jgi:hypothetical protein